MAEYGIPAGISGSRECSNFFFGNVFAFDYAAARAAREMDEIVVI